MVNLHDYVKYDEEEEACVLGLPVMPLKPPEGFEGEECAKDHPNGLSARIVAVDSGHDDDMPANNLEIYFSNNYGEDFYNPDTPREAVHRDVFSRRLLKVKEGTEEEKEDKSRELLAAFHEESSRRLCRLGRGLSCSSNKECDATAFLGCLNFYCQSYFGGTIGTSCGKDDDCDYDELTCDKDTEKCVIKPDDGSCDLCARCVNNRCPNSAGVYGLDNTCWGGNYGDGCYEDYLGFDTCVDSYECKGPGLGEVGCGICK